MSESHNHHHHIHKAASHSVSHTYVEYGHNEKFVTKHKTVVEAVLLDEAAAKKAEEEHLAEDARQAELAREAIAAAKAAEDEKAAEELILEEERRAEETKAIVANSRKSMRWPPVGESFSQSSSGFLTSLLAIIHSILPHHCLFYPEYKPIFLDNLFLSF